MYICIEGNIGAGKSTLAKALAKHLKGIYLPEVFEENTMLSLFYEQPKKYAFLTEYSFLLDRQKQITQHFKHNHTKITISDYHFDKCLCFAKVNLKGKDLSYFKKHVKAIKPFIKKPDLIIYLNTPIDLITKNIKTRGRDIEKTIELSYLKNLKKSLDSHYVLKNNTGTKVVVLNQYFFNATSLNDLVKHIKLIIKTQV